MQKEPHRFYYGWVIVAVSFVTLFLALGARISFGVFFVAIVGEFGWGRGETAGAFSLAMFVHAFFAPITGNLIDRFSPRILFPIGAVFLTIGLLGASRINEIWHLYVFFGIIMAIGINAIGFGPHAALIPRWFIRKRGLATGIALSGFGLGALVVAPATEFFIETTGWRSAFLILAGTVFCIITPMTALFQRRSPEDAGQRPDNLSPGTKDVTLLNSENGRITIDNSYDVKNWTFKAAICTSAFWWIGLTAFCHGSVVNMLLVHQAAYIVDAGHDGFLAASSLGLVGLMGSFGAILFGFISDRFGKKVGITLGGSAAFLGVLFFLLLEESHSFWLLYTFIILYGIGQGSFSPIYVSTMGDLFPGSSLGRIMSSLSIGYGFGGALGSYIAGFFYDRMGTYIVPFLLLLVSISMAALGIWMAAPRNRYHHRSG